MTVSAQATPAPQEFAREVVAAARKLRSAARREQATRGGKQRGQAAVSHRISAEEYEFFRALFASIAGGDHDFQAALELHDTAKSLPDSLRGFERAIVRAGGALSLSLPWLTMPIARGLLRERVSPLLLSVRGPASLTSTRLTEELRGELLAAGITGQGGKSTRPLVLEPLGDAVFGAAGAAAEGERLTELFKHACEQRLSGGIVVDVQRLAPEFDAWQADEAAATVSSRLSQLLTALLSADEAGAAAGEAAAAAGERQEEATSAGHSSLSCAVLLRAPSVWWVLQLPVVLEPLLADPALRGVKFGVYLPVNLPETTLLYSRITRAAQQRVAAGGASCEVVLEWPRYAEAEAAASLREGLPVPVIADHTESLAQALRLLRLLLHSGRAASVKPVLASEDSLLLAAACRIAAEQGCGGLWGVQLRRGLAGALAAALTAQPGAPGTVQLRTPLAPASEPRAVARYLTALASEAAELATVRAQETTFTAACEAAATRSAQDVTSHRIQRRAREWDPSERDSALFYRPPEEPARFDTGGLTAAVLGLAAGETGELRLTEVAPPRTLPPVSDSGFAGEPTTDVLVDDNRRWVREQLGVAVVAADGAGRADEVAPAAEPCAAAAPTPLATPGTADEAAPSPRPQETDLTALRSAAARRARSLRHLALALAAERDQLLGALAAVAQGAPPAWLDEETNYIIDSARYLAQLTERQTVQRGAILEPVGTVLVAAEAAGATSAVPVSVHASAVFAALAAGNRVLWAVPPEARQAAAAVLTCAELASVAPGRITVVSHPAAPGGYDELAEQLAATPPRVLAVYGSEVFAREIAALAPDAGLQAWHGTAGSLLLTPAAEVDAAVPIVARSLLTPAGEFGGARVLVLLGSLSAGPRFKAGLVDALASAHSPLGTDPLLPDYAELAEPPTGEALRALTQLESGEEWWLQPRQLDAEGRVWSPGIRAGVAPDSWFWRAARGLPLLGVTVAHTLGEAVELQRVLGGESVAGLISTDAGEQEAWAAAATAARLVINGPTGSARVERQPRGAWGEAGAGELPLAGGPHWLYGFGEFRPRAGSPSETLHLRGLQPEVRALIEAAQSDLAYADFDQVRRAALADELAWSVTLGVERDVAGLGVEANLLRYQVTPVHVRVAADATLAAAVRVLAAALRARGPVTLESELTLPEPVLDVLARCGVEFAPAAAGVRVRQVGGGAKPVTMAGAVEMFAFVREQSLREVL